MKLHTSLTASEVADALGTVKNLGRAGTDVEFAGLRYEKSLSRRHGYVIHLASETKTGPDLGPRTARRRVNSGVYGAGEWYAATWEEWGWFMAEVYALDPAARWSCGYRDSADFHRKTGGRFAAAVFQRAESPLLARATEQAWRETAGTPGYIPPGPEDYALRDLGDDRLADPIVFGSCAASKEEE